MRYFLLIVILMQLLVSTPVVAAQKKTSMIQRSAQRVNVEALEIGRGFDWRRDWWKYLCMILGVLLVLFLSLYLTKMLFRTMLFAASMTVGSLGALLLSPRIMPYMTQLLPDAYRRGVWPQALSYAVTFLITYFIAMLVMRIVKAPAKKKEENEE